MYSILEMSLRALLCANLNNAVVCTGRLDHLLPLFNGERDGFLYIYVFARFAGFNRHERMPVIRRCDDNSINVGTRNNLSEVPICGGAYLFFLPGNGKRLV